MRRAAKSRYPAFPRGENSLPPYSALSRSRPPLHRRRHLFWKLGHTWPASPTGRTDSWLLKLVRRDAGWHLVRFQRHRMTATPTFDLDMGNAGGE